MYWYANQKSTTFTAKTDRFNISDQSLVRNFMYVKTFLAAPIVPINLATCAVLDLCCDWLWDVQLNHIGIYIWGRFILPPYQVIVRTLFLHLPSSKNEVPPVPFHPNKSTQHRLHPVYRPIQQYTHISPFLELYVRQVRHQIFPCCRINNANEMETMLPQLFSSRHWWKVWVCANDIDYTTTTMNSSSSKGFGAGTSKTWTDTGYMTVVSKVVVVVAAAYFSPPLPQVEGLGGSGVYSLTLQMLIVATFIATPSRLNLATTKVLRLPNTVAFGKISTSSTVPTVILVYCSLRSAAGT